MTLGEYTWAMFECAGDSMLNWPINKSNDQIKWMLPLPSSLPYRWQIDMCGFADEFLLDFDHGMVKWHTWGWWAGPRMSNTIYQGTFGTYKDVFTAFWLCTNCINGRINKDRDGGWLLFGRIETYYLNNEPSYVAAAAFFVQAHHHSGPLFIFFYASRKH